MSANPKLSDEALGKIKLFGAKVLGVRQVDPRDVDTHFLVRVEMNQEWVHTLASILAAGREFKEPIVVIELPDGKYLMIDGRHRVEAKLEVNDFSVWAACVDIQPSDRNTQLMLATILNISDRLPEQAVDVKNVIERLMDARVPQSRIREMFGRFFPEQLLMRTIRLSRDRLEMKKMRLARADVATGGHTVEDAATRRGVRAEKLRVALKGVGGKEGEKAAREKGMRQKKTERSRSLNAAVKSIAQGMRAILKDLADGLTTPDEGLELLIHVETAVRRVQNALERHSAPLVEMLQEQGITRTQLGLEEEPEE